MPVPSHFPALHRLTWPLGGLPIAAFAFLVAGCGFEPETREQALLTYQKNVESCLCRSLDFEADFPSGVSYRQMLASCNETVHNANPTRYDDSLYSEPAIETLRCQDEVEPWLEVVGEHGLR